MQYFRLEAATSRLEDIATATIDPSASTNGVSTSAGMVGAPALPGQTSSKAVTLAPIAESLPDSIVDFDSLISGDVQSFVKLSEKIGGQVAEQVRKLQVSLIVLHLIV